MRTSRGAGRRVIGVLAVVVATALAVLVLVPAAGAQDDGNYPPSSTSTTVVDPGPPTEVSPGGTELPFTGGDAAALVVVGFVVVAVGVALVRAGRSRAPTEG